MTQAPLYDLCAIGNAIVDILAPTSDEFIASQADKGMNRGMMMLIDQKRAEEIYNQMGPATEMSGGSAANTMACFASFGGTGAYIGKVANDKFGKIFAHDLQAMNVTYQTKPLTHGAPTALCLILVSPDATRTMNTYLGASVLFSPDDVDEEIVQNSAVTYLEGYLFDAEPAKRAFFKAAEIVARHNRKLSLTLSDPFCVHRHRDDFLKLIENHVDILFCNHEELLALYQSDNLKACMDHIRHHCEIVVVTHGARGSFILQGETTFEIPAVPPRQLIDTTGAGDSYAAGFLFGYVRGKDLATCGQYGSLAASEIIAQMGPRPMSNLKSLISIKAAE
jgi:sugar/nucleoside kinase (ribokinase family)